MPQPRQRHIPLNIDDRRELDRRKKDYEDATGDSGDWGRFLRTVSLAGLASLGIYALSPLARIGPTAWRVDCPRCAVGFPVQVPNPPPGRLAQLRCPNCSGELVIDFASPQPATPDGEGSRPDAASVTYCQYCEQPIETSFSQIGPRGIEYLECPRCGRVPRVSAPVNHRAVGGRRRAEPQGEETEE